MNLEEAKAILDTFTFRIKTKNYNKIGYDDIEAIKTVLNLIGKQQKEIEDSDFCIELCKKSQDIAIKALEKKEQKLEEYEAKYNKALKDIIKTSKKCSDKDKIIKSMAETIFYLDKDYRIGNTITEISEYFTKKAREM